MARYDVPPTKSSLFQVKADLGIAREGFELLEQKREILVMELMRMVEQVKLLEHDLDKRVATAYASLKRMIVTVGRQSANEISAGIRFPWTVHEKQGRLMGIPLPTVEMEVPRLELKYSFMGTDGSCDRTMVEFFELLRLVARLAEIRTMVWRLAREVRKTQRRVNALEKVVIPDVLETKGFIEGVLEEREREVFFVQKILKARLGERT
ncbi:MAG: V-type ATP synthase subunit D [Spirochaetes bacterium]|nr:V-type ATP synthase subunit D [Spirochaetota bacterium]